MMPGEALIADTDRQQRGLRPGASRQLKARRQTRLSYPVHHEEPRYPADVRRTPDAGPARAIYSRVAPRIFP